MITFWFTIPDHSIPLISFTFQVPCFIVMMTSNSGYIPFSLVPGIGRSRHISTTNNWKDIIISYNNRSFNINLEFWYTYMFFVKIPLYCKSNLFSSFSSLNKNWTSTMWPFDDITCFSLTPPLQTVTLLLNVVSVTYL